MIHVVAGVLLAAALLVSPGLLLARLGDVRNWAAASAALPLSCAVIGTSEILAALAGWAWVPWGWGVIAGVTALAAGILVRRPQVGAKGLVYARVEADGNVKSSVDKFYTQDVLQKLKEKFALMSFL